MKGDASDDGGDEAVVVDPSAVRGPLSTTTLRHGSLDYPPEPVTLDSFAVHRVTRLRVASFVLILAWLVVWSIDVRNPAPAFAGVVFARLSSW